MPLIITTAFQSPSTLWTLNNPSYVQNFDVSGQDNDPFGVMFKPDGTKMYVVGNTNNRVFEYDLSTPWSVSSATFNQQSNLTLGGGFQRDGTFKSDGTKIYISIEVTASINEYDLSVAYDVSTMSFVQTLNTSGDDNAAAGVVFKPDGTEMYIPGRQFDSIYQYTLSSAWDISTASLSNTKSIVAQDNSVTSVDLKSDGRTMFITGVQNNRVYQYTLSTPWNVSTASFDQFYDPTTNTPNPQDVFVKPDGSKMYLVDSGFPDDQIDEYNL